MQFRPKTPHDFDIDVVRRLQNMPIEQLRTEARKLAKQSNQRLKRLEDEGYTSHYAYRKAMEHLSGVYESQASSERGYASFATKSGKRFKERTSRMSRNELITMYRQMVYHLRRETTKGMIEETHRKRMEGMRRAVEEVFSWDLGESENYVSNSDILGIFENVAYNQLNQMYGYKTAISAISAKMKTNKKTLEKMGKETREGWETFKKDNPNAQLMDYQPFRDLLKYITNNQ